MTVSTWRQSLWLEVYANVPRDVAIVRPNMRLRVTSLNLSIIALNEQDADEIDGGKINRCRNVNQAVAAYTMILLSCYSFQ